MSISLDFGWFFKGKELDGVIKDFEKFAITKEKNSSVTFSALDISDAESLNNTVDAIYKEYKRTLGSWFEKHKKSAIKSTLVEAKIRYIAETATCLHYAFLERGDLNKLNQKDIEYIIKHSEHPTRELYSSTKKLSCHELSIIKRGQNRDILFDIFDSQSESKAEKNERVDQNPLASQGVMRLGSIFNKHSSKFRSVVRHINKEFMRIRSDEKLAESKKEFEEKYQMYLDRNFRDLSHEDIRKCDEYLVDNLKKNLSQGNRGIDPKAIPKLADIRNHVADIRNHVADIRNHVPDLWKKFTPSEKEILKYLLPAPFNEKDPASTEIALILTSDY